MPQIDLLSIEEAFVWFAIVRKVAENMRKVVILVAININRLNKVIRNFTRKHCVQLATFSSVVVGLAQTM